MPCSAGVLGAVVAAVAPGVSTIALCKLGDELILKETSAVYNKKVDGKTTDKGVGFPTCISINEIVCQGVSCQLVMKMFSIARTAPMPSNTEEKASAARITHRNMHEIASVLRAVS